MVTLVEVFKVFKILVFFHYGAQAALQVNFNSTQLQLVV
jgi:hypothetical protein